MQRRIGLWLAVAGLASGISLSSSATAAQLQEAEISRIIKEVQLLPEQAASRPAVVKDSVRGGTAVRTGSDSRTELTFTDQTLTRLGANTIFSFGQGTRNLNLGGGVVLVHVPKGSGGAKIVTAGVTAGITGTTVMLEYHPDSSQEPSITATATEHSSAGSLSLGALQKTKRSNRVASGPVKLIVLEGTVRMYFTDRPGESVLVPAGHILVVGPNATSFPESEEVDLERLVKTSLLFVDFGPFAGEPLIALEIARQREQKAKGELVESDTPYYWDETSKDPPPLDTLDLHIASTPPGSPPAGGGGPGPTPPPPPPNPVEIGPLNTITTPNPYVINATTSIFTAPTITTNGILDQGKFYRGPALDGIPSLYLFGATSAFDSFSGFNEEFMQPDNLPMAAFKFNSLQLAGNPTMDIPANGATKLVLVSIGALTSGPGGILTFAGLDTLVLTTQNAAINLGPGISFSGPNKLVFYARGAGSNLTLASPISNVEIAELYAEGSAQVNAATDVTTFFSNVGVDFLAGTGAITAQNINIVAQNNINFVTNQFALGPGVTGISLSLNAGNILNIDVKTDDSVLEKAAAVFADAQTINFTGDPGGTLIQFIDAPNPINFNAISSGGIQAAGISFFHPGGALTMTSGGNIIAQSILGGSLISATGDINIVDALVAATITSSKGVHVGTFLRGTEISAATDITAGDLTALQSVTAGTTINVTNTLNATNVSAGGNITAGKVVVQNINPGVALSTTTLTAQNGGITPFAPFNSPNPTPDEVQHVFNVATVESHAAGVIGLNFSGGTFGPGNNGGILTLNTSGSQLFTAASGINTANFDGADQTAPGQPAGNGGSFTLNARGSIFQANGSPITATTGQIDTNDPPSGAGGTVNLTSGADITLVDDIQVSSGEAPTGVPRRSSASGGNINITSTAGTGTAITISNSAQLLSLLEAAAPGPNGLITILATGGSSNISAGGLIQADTGSGSGPDGGVDIRHTGTGGQIAVNNATLRGDIIKVAALGTTGTLNIGTGNTIEANTLIKLYASGSNGTLNFMGNVTLKSPTSILAANTIHIDGGVTVTISSAQPAQIFTNNPDYQGNGGTGNPATTGMFSGPVTNPMPLDNNTPAIGPPGQM